jgi:hypothetical protein
MPLNPRTYCTFKFLTGSYIDGDIIVLMRLIRLAKALFLFFLCYTYEPLAMSSYLIARLLVFIEKVRDVKSFPFFSFSSLNPV